MQQQNTSNSNPSTVNQNPMNKFFTTNFNINEPINQVPFTTTNAYSNLENGNTVPTFSFFTNPNLSSTFTIDPRFQKNPNPKVVNNNNSNSSQTFSGNFPNNNNTSSSSNVNNPGNNFGNNQTGKNENVNSNMKTNSGFTQYKNNNTIALDVVQINQLTDLIRKHFDGLNYGDICNGVNPTMNFKQFNKERYEDARKVSEELPLLLTSEMKFTKLVGIRNFKSKYVVFSNEENNNKEVNLIKKPDWKNKRILLSMLDSIDSIGERLENNTESDPNLVATMGNWKLFLNKTKFFRKEGEKFILQIPDIYLSLCTEIIIMFGSPECLFDDRTNATIVKCLMELKINLILIGGLLCLFNAEPTYINFMKFCKGLKDMSAPKEYSIDFKIILPGEDFPTSSWLDKDEFPRKLSKVIRYGYFNFLQGNEENSNKTYEQSQTIQKAYQKVWDSKDVNQLNQNTRLVEITKKFISGDEQLGKLVESCKSAKGFLRAFFSKNVATVRDEKDAYENALVVRKKLINGYINSKGPLTIATIKKIGSIGSFISTRIERLYDTTFGKMSRENVSWFGLTLTEFMDYFSWTSNVILRAKSLHEKGQLTFVYSTNVSNEMIQSFLSANSNSLPKLIELRCCLPNLYGIFCTNGTRKDKLDCFELCKSTLGFVEFKKTWAQWSELDSFWMKVTNDAKATLTIVQQNVCRKNLGLPELTKGVNNLQSAIRNKLNGSSNFDFFKNSIQNRTSMFSVFTKEEREERAKAMKEKRMKEEENRKKNSVPKDENKGTNTNTDDKGNENKENTNSKPNTQEKSNPVFMKSSYSVSEKNERLKNKETTEVLPKIEISDKLKTGLVPEFNEGQVSKESSEEIQKFKDKYLMFLQEYGAEPRNLEKLKEAFLELGDWLVPLTLVSETFRKIANSLKVVVPDSERFTAAADLFSKDDIPVLNIGDSMLSMEEGKLVIT